MSAFRTMFDFLKHVPEALQHEGIYRQKMAGSKAGMPDDIDVNAWEMKTVGPGERNLLRSLNIADKFRCPGMDEFFTVVSGSLAKTKDKTIGKGSLSFEKTYVESFLIKDPIDLEPIEVSVKTSGRTGLIVPNDAPLHTQICHKLKGIAGGSLISPSISLLGEKVVIKQDLRHLFLKGYLMLMSYNLSIASDTADLEFNPISADIRPGISGLEKLGVLLAYPLVVDADQFTTNELWLLTEMAGSYPNSIYGKDNIYNGLQMEADILTILSENKHFSLGDNPGWGSPERMWAELVSIATKFEAMDDLEEVIRDFRGMPAILREVSERSGKSVFSLGYPKSYSVRLGIIPVGSRRSFLKRNSGYYATTKCLVADLMLGRMMMMSTFNVLEELGTFGTLGCPTGDAFTDIFLNSNLRQYGMKHDGDMENYLIREWRGVRNCTVPISFDGSLKKYAQKLAGTLRGGDISELRPQLLMDLPYSECWNTTWGTVHGWRMQEFVFTDEAEKRIADNQLVKAFTWVMGLGGNLPRVGLNSKGDKFIEPLTLEESKFIQLASGQYEIGLVRHTMGSELEPRMDEFEMGAEIFYHTSFPGTKCAVVFDFNGVTHMVQEQKVSDAYGTSTVGFNRPEGEVRGSYMTPGGSMQQWEYTQYEQQGDVQKPPMNGNDLFRIRGDGNDQAGPGDGPELGIVTPGGEEDQSQEDGGACEINVPDPKNVVVQEMGQIGYRLVPQLKIENGVPVPQKVELSDGSEAEVVVMPNRTVLAGDSIRGYRLKTKGDGTCGIHAIMQDRMLKGYIDEDIREESHRKVLDWVGSEIMHNVSEIGGICSYLNNGCVIIDVNNKRRIEFGTQGVDDIVYLVLENGHYETFIPSDRGPSEFANFRRDPSDYSPQEQIRAIISVQNALKSDYLANLALPREMRKLRKSHTGDGFEKFFEAIPKSMRVNEVKYAGTPNNSSRAPIKPKMDQKSEPKRAADDGWRTQNKKGFGQRQQYSGAHDKSTGHTPYRGPTGSRGPTNTFNSVQGQKVPGDYWRGGASQGRGSTTSSRGRGSPAPGAGRGRAVTPKLGSGAWLARK